MKIASLSDIHISSGKHNSCKIQDEEFYIFLLTLLTYVDRVYLNGDFLDLWKSKWPTKKSQFKELNNINKEYPKTLKLILDEPRIIWNAGNHDELVQRIDGNDRDIIINSNGEKILIWHGQLDIFNKYFSFIGRIITYIEFNIEKFLKLLRLNFLFKYLKKAYYYFGFRNKKQINQFKKNIDNDDNLICVFNGHTHKAQILEFEYNNKNRIYINTGHFDSNTKNIVILDTESFNIEANIEKRTKLTKIKNTLKEGDIIFISKNRDNLFSDIINNIFKIEYEDILIYLGDSKVVKVDIVEGVSIENIKNYLDGKYILGIYRLKDQEKQEKFISSVISKLGIRFSLYKKIINKIKIFFNINIEVDVENEITPEELVCLSLINANYTIRENSNINTIIKRTDIFNIIEIYKI